MNKTHLLSLGKSSGASRLVHHSRPLQRQGLALISGKKSFSLILLISFLFATLARAQQIQSGTGAPAAAFEVANGTRQFTVTVLGGATSSGSLVVTLPAGFVYESGSATGSGGLTVSQTSVSGNTATLNLSGIPATGTNATFTYKARAGCDAIGGAGNQASYVFTPSGGSAQPEKLSDAFNLVNARLNITTLTNAPATAGVVGDNYTRSFRISNDGFGNIDTLYVTDISGNGVAHLSHSVSTTNNGATVTVDLISSTPSGSNTTYLYRFIVSSTAQDNHLGQNEYFTFTQNLQLSACTDVNTNLNAWYGTGPNPQPCAGQNDTQTTALAIDNSKQPNLVISSVTATPLICKGQNYLQEFRITNTGTAAAKDVLLRLIHLWGNSASLPGHELGRPIQDQTGFLQGTFKYKIGASGTYVSVPVNAASGVTLNNQKNYTPASCLPALNAPAELDLVIPDLQAGEAIYFQYEETTCCTTTCLAGGDFNPSQGSQARLRYNNLCGIQISNNLTSGEGTILRNYTTASYDIQEDFPSDMVPGTAYTFKWESTRAAWNGGTYPTGSTIHYQVTLPAGVIYSAPNAVNLLLRDGSNLAPTSVAQTGQVMDIIFTVPSNSFTPAKSLLTVNSLMLDCAGVTGGSNTINTKIFLNSAGCACTQQMYCADKTVQLHCPAPCPDPSMVNEGFTIKRTNYGQPDNNNDGQPDGSTLSSNVRTNWVLRGDTLAFEFKGHVFDNAATSPVNFQYGYARFSFPTTSGSHLSALYANVLITDAGGTVTKVSKSGLPVTYTSSGGTTTAVVDYSIAALAAAGYTSFTDTDKVTVTAYLKVTDDLGGRLAVTPVTTKFYLSNAANPTATGTDVWYCDNYAGEFTLVGMMSYAVNNQTYSGNECNTISSNFALGFVVGEHINNGGPGVNFFKDEYRQLAVADKLEYTVPAGYTLEEFRVSYRRGAAGYGQSTSPVIILTPDAVSGNVNTYNLRNKFADQGGPWLLPDEGFVVDVRAVLRPTCESASISQDYLKLFTVPGTDFKETLPPGSNIQTQFTPESKNTINLIKSNIVVNAATPVKTVTGNTVTWEVQIANTQPGTSPKVWMGENSSPANGVTITSVEPITGFGGTTSGATLSSTAGIYELGVYGQESRYYKITASFTNCGQDVLPLAVGYVCGNYPASIDAAACKKTVDLTVIPTPANLQVSLLSQPVPTYPDGTADLCQELEYIAEVKNPAQGTAFDLKFTVQKPAGVAYIANSYQLSPTILPAAASLVNVNNDALVVETATSITFTIPASVAANLPYNQGYTIRYKVRTLACDFVSGTKMNLQALGNNGCGSAIIGTRQQTQTVRIKGENPNPNAYTISSNVPAVDACNPAPVTYTFSAVNEGPVATYAGEKLVITIPQPFTLGTVTGISNFTSGAVPVVNSTATATTYTWTMPLGVAAGQTISFSAPLSATAADLASVSCSTLPIHELIAYTFESKCEPSGPVCTGSLQAEGENDATGIVINKPAFAITAFTAGTPTSGNTLEGTVTVANTNGIATGLPQNAVIKVYHDANSNGVVDATDTQIGSKTVSLTTTTSQVFNYAFTTDYLGDFCPAIVEITPECACESPVIYTYTDCETILPVTLHSFTASPSEAGVLLKWSTVTETNSGRFEIQQSTDAKTWKAIGTVDAAGDSPVMSHYSFTDVSPASGQNYYRLKMIDLDGSFDYSKIETILVDAQSIQWVSLYPNPVTDHFALKSDEKMVVRRVDIYDQKGNLVYSTQEKPFNRINVEKLNAGIYQVKVTGAAGEISIQRMVKK